MDLKKLTYYYNKFKFGEDNFYNLMQNRIKEILLVSTFYDAFIFEQDGRLAEKIFGEYRQLNLSTSPRITSVPTGTEALKLLKEKDFDLVITMMRIGEISPFNLSKEVKKIANIPVVLLLNIQSDISILKRNKDQTKYLDDVFLWNGDTKLFLAIIKTIEDKLNLHYDTTNGNIQVILLVEDSINFYSSYLPILYEEIMKQTQHLIKQEVTDINKRLRMRARPKVILAKNYEQASKIFEKYQNNIIAVISDVKYPHKGKLNKKAGFYLTKKVKSLRKHIPIVLQSSGQENKTEAEKLGAVFINKNSKKLIYSLRSFIKDRLGFGEFRFKDDKGRIVAKANSVFEFVKCLETIDIEVLIKHAKKNHYSKWLIAHGESTTAQKIFEVKVSDFEIHEDVRKYLIDIFHKVSLSKTQGKIINFSEKNLEMKNQIVKISSGSLGGKGRGLAFLNALLVTMEFDEKFPEVKITIPKTCIIGTNEFDTFIETNGIDDWILEKNDEEIKKIFNDCLLSDNLKNKLAVYVENTNYPIAVRSSGLLEDSQSQPFAGIYDTYMLPNTDKIPLQKRYEILESTVKQVYASVFLKNARNYIESIHYKVEEEKMGVILQEIVGNKYDDYFYPNISGVGQSFNYYPTSYSENQDGIVSIALGLGKWVVDGDSSFRFCPKYPGMNVVSETDILKDSQKQFYAINMNLDEVDLSKGELSTLKKLPIRVAEKQGNLKNIASVWDYMNNRMRHNLHCKGMRVITFANILKHNYFPLAKIVNEILKIGETSMGVPVEIEFAIDLDNSTENRPVFYILQIRPLTVNSEEIYIEPANIDKKDLLLFTENGLGNGMIDSIKDVIFVKPEKFDRLKTKEMLLEIKELNKKMKDTEYILLGPGRWGSRDEFLGIPVKWADINNAKIIVEYGLKDFAVDSSQGTHFFHNIVSMNVGYFSVPFASQSDFIDWDWLNSLEVKDETKYFKHVECKKPLKIKMDGKKAISVIFK